MRPGGASSSTCSAFPPALRSKVIDAWTPVARVYQAFSGFLTMTSVAIGATSGPLVVILAPIFFLSLCLNILPYLVVELLIDCDPSSQTQRQAKLLKANLDTLRALPKNVPIPGWGELRRAIDLIYPFVDAAAAGKNPSTDAVNQLASAAGILNGIDPGILGAILGAAEWVGIKAPKAAANQWKAADATNDARVLSKEKAIAAAKVKARAEIEAKAKDNAKAKIIDEAKVKARAEIEAKARANAAAGITVGAADVAGAAKASAPSSMFVPVVAAAGVAGGIYWFTRRRKRA